MAEPRKQKRDNFLTQFRLNHKLHSVDFMTIWQHYDKSKSGYLDEKETRNFLKDLVTARGEKADPSSMKTYEEVVSSTFDKNRNGRIEISEFARLLPTEQNFLLKSEYRHKMTRKEFDEIFSHYDKSKSGTLTRDELLALLRDLFDKNHQKMEQKDLEAYQEAIFMIYDISADGVLQKDEVGLLLSKTE